MPDPHDRESTTPVYFTSLDEIKSTSYEQNLTHYFGIGAHCGSTDINMHVAHLPAGKRGRAHFHLRSDIALFVLDGEATMITWNQNYEKNERIVKKGDFVFVPRGTLHNEYNHTDEEFVLIACYNNVGTGPESLKIYVEEPPN